MLHFFGSTRVSLPRSRPSLLPTHMAAAEVEVTAAVPEAPGAPAAAPGAAPAGAGGPSGAGAGGGRKNRIQVSNTKKPLYFYINLSKVDYSSPDYLHPLKGWVQGIPSHSGSARESIRPVLPSQFTESPFSCCIAWHPVGATWRTAVSGSVDQVEYSQQQLQNRGCASLSVHVPGPADQDARTASQDPATANQEPWLPVPNLQP